MDSAAFAEQTIYRRIAKMSDAVDMTPSTRKVLTKFINLWFRHRGTGSFEQSHDVLARSLSIADKTLRLALNWLRRMGFVHSISGGCGRGRITRYVVDLTRIQEVLCPDLRVRCRGETVDLDGEIKPVIRGSVKPVISPAPYIRNKIPCTPSRQGLLVVTLRKTVGWETLGTALRRIATNRRAWFRPNPKQPGWEMGLAA